jgi:hypothetical protein
MGENQAPKPKSAVRVDEDAGTVAIGATIDGVFVPFYTLAQTEVDALVASGKVKAEAAEAEAAAA